MKNESKTKTQLLEEIGRLKREIEKYKKAGIKKDDSKISQRRKFNEFQKILEKNPYPMAILQDGEHKYVTPAFTELFGYTLNELKGKSSFFKLIQPKDIESVQQRFNARMGGKKLTKTFIIDLVAKNGKIIPCETSAVVIEYNNKPANLTIIRDISTLKLTETALLESELRYRNLIESMHDGVVMYNDKGLVNYLNKRMGEILDYEVKEIIGQPLIDFFMEGERSQIKNMFNKRGKGEPVSLELTLKKKNGEKVNVLVSSRTLRDADNHYQGNIAVVTDISEQKRTMETYRAVVDNSLQGLIILQDDKVVFCNPSMLKIANLRKNRLMGMSFWNLSKSFHPDYRDTILKRYRNRKRGDTRPSHYEFKAITPGNREFWGDLYVSSIEYHGKPAVQIAVVDITARKKAEEELKKTSEKLELDRIALREKNTALKEVLSFIEVEKNAIRRQLASNVKNVLIPALQRLKENSPPGQINYIEHLEKELKSIISAKKSGMSDLYNKLSPREMEICQMIKNGNSSRSISEMLNISILTVHKHREIIRNKLKIKNKNINLGSFLRSL